MPSCIVKGCSYSWKKKDPNIILHSFPNDIVIIKSWLLQTKQDFGSIDDFSGKVLQGKKTDSYRICSQHFAMDCYYQRGMITSLKKDAMPTIFPDKVIREPVSFKKKIGKPPSKKVCISAPSTAAWGDVDGSDTTTSIVMGLPLRIVKIEPDFIEPSTSSSMFPPENPFSLSAKISLEKRMKVSEQVYSSPKAPRKNGGAGNPFTMQRESRTVGTNTEYFPGQRHKSTRTDPNVGVKHRDVQTEKPKGIQCLCGLQGLASLQQDTSRSFPTGTTSSSQTEPLQMTIQLTSANYTTVMVPQYQLGLPTVSPLSDVHQFPESSVSRRHMEVVDAPVEGSTPLEETVPNCVNERTLSPVPLRSGSESAPHLGRLVSGTEDNSSPKQENAHRSTKQDLKDTAYRPTNQDLKDTTYRPTNQDLKDTTYRPTKEEVEEAKSEQLEIPEVKPEDVNFTGIEIPEATGPQDPISENKYIVFDSCLNKLIMSCRCLAVDDCDGRIISFKKYFIGSSVSVNAKCSKGHAFHMWDSQP